MNRWLSRLAFSLLIISFVLAWEAYRVYSGRAVGGNGRIMLYTVAAALSFSLAVRGLRLRHREDPRE